MANQIGKKQEDFYLNFYNWLKSQPKWLQDAAWRIYNNKKIEYNQIEIYKEMCKKQAANEDVQHNSLEATTVVPSNTITTTSINILFDITGVNALSEKASLTFGENGITVVFGLNGAGKSGYMRIFKKVCNHPCAEIIQPNVFKSGNTTEPTCKFRITHNGEQTDYLCHLNKIDEITPLRKCDAFDTKISSAYIEDKNSVSYEPFVFSVLSELAKVASNIENSLETELKGYLPIDIGIPKEFQAVKSTNFLYNINEKTIIPSDFLVWSDEDEKELLGVTELLSTNDLEQQLQWHTKKKQNISSVSELIKELNLSISPENLIIIKDLYSKYKIAEQTYNSAKNMFSDKATNEDNISMSSEVWRQLWSLAKKYYDDVLFTCTGIPFASENSICPLCHNKIEGELFDRFISVNDYINGTCSQEFENAKNNLKEKLKHIISITIETNTLKNMLESFVSEELLQKIFSVFNKLNKLEINDTENCYKEIIALSVSDISDKLNAILSESENKIKEIKQAQNSEDRLLLKNKLLELKSRKWICSNQEVILQEIEKCKKKSNIYDALKLVKTNKITSESNNLANELITEAYIQRFENELKQLAPKIKVKIEKGQSSKGKTPYKVSLETENPTKAKTSEVLSEGEQRIVALAAFFADATGRNENTPIIIDDPISSLDSIYEQKATKRIADLAKNRQVIVFTHRISFLVGLIDECENIGVDCCQRFIRSAYSGKGIADFDSIYHGKLTTQLEGLISDLKENTKRDPDSQDYINCKDKTCQQFRICVERAVEEVLLSGIVKRFDKRIMTNGKLEKLLKIEEDDCKIIDSMMTKYSYNEHSQAADGPYIDFENEEIIEDISNFKQWIKNYNKK